MSRPEIEVEQRDDHVLTRVTSGSVRLVAAIDPDGSPRQRDYELKRAVRAIERSVAEATFRADGRPATKYGPQEIEPTDEELLTDGGGEPTRLTDRTRIVEFSCAVCRESHATRASALRCCGDRFDDGDDLAAGQGGESA